MNKNRITQSIVLSLTTLTASLSWYFLNKVFINQVDFCNWLILFGCFLFLLILLGLAWLLIKTKIVLFTTLVIVLISFCLSFQFRVEYLIGLFVAFLFFLLGSLKALQEKENRLKIEVEKILETGLPLIVTGLSLMIALSYYFSPLVLKQSEEITLPRSVFDFLFKYNSLLNKDDTLIKENQQSRNFFPSKKPDYRKKQKTNNTTEPLKTHYSELTENKKQELYQITNQRLKELLKPYQAYLPLCLTLILFFVLKGIGSFLMWLAIGLTKLLFWILVKTKAITIQQKPVWQEVIEV